ncbi:MAG: glucose-1-phosphate adenylyltransferase subunit GlgD, partial [Clostridia bacterium]|nr:glucose-1-phosphate adenylyltransferase subunit GlgD [Clostridia bacterium]
IGHIDALYGILDFIKDSKENYVVLYDADILCNIDINAMLEQHIATEADITIAYKSGALPQNNRDIMAFTFKDGRVDSIRLSDKAGEECDYSLDIMIMERQKLIELITSAAERNFSSLSRHVLQPNVDKIKIYGFEMKEYAVVMDSTKTYFKANMDLLEGSVRAQLFNPARPIYTKTRDNMPAKYGLESDVANSLVADGCVIEGTVRNSLIFRNVHIGKGAVVENCIIMQDGVIGDGAQLKYVATDKEVSVSPGRTLAGAETYPLIIAKGTNV